MLSPLLCKIRYRCSIEGNAVFVYDKGEGTLLGCCTGTCLSRFSLSDAAPDLWRQKSALDFVGLLLLCYCSGQPLEKDFVLFIQEI